MLQSTRLRSASVRIFGSNLRVHSFPPRALTSANRLAEVNSCTFPGTPYSCDEVPGFLPSGRRTQEYLCKLPRRPLAFRTQPLLLFDSSHRFRSVKSTRHAVPSCRKSEAHGDRSPLDDKEATGPGHQGGPSTAGSTGSWKPPPGVSEALPSPWVGTSAVQKGK